MSSAYRLQAKRLPCRPARRSPPSHPRTGRELCHIRAKRSRYDSASPRLERRTFDRESCRVRTPGLMLVHVLQRERRIIWRLGHERRARLGVLQVRDVVKAIVFNARRYVRPVCRLVRPRENRKYRVRRTWGCRLEHSSAASCARTWTTCGSRSGAYGSHRLRSYAEG